MTVYHTFDETMDDHNFYPPGPPPGLDSRDVRYSTGRTPSPTPSEVAALSTNFINWKKFMNWRFWARKAWISAWSCV
ncbi:MAG TPA: hypothetical protein VGO47_07650 [Chlamydiales bacterium]|nr:hypothetical protein [Chlamydiales bacterium]